MEDNKQHLDALNDIRQLMKQSNRFLSLSGFSGIFVGLYAIIGAYIGNSMIMNFIHDSKMNGYSDVEYYQLIFKCVVVSFIILLLSIMTAFLFTALKAKKNKQKLFDHAAKLLLINMFIPLATGGVVCFAMLFHGGSFVVLIAPITLLFYGLALINASKYTLHDIRYLGYFQILLGLAAIFYLQYTLLFWTIGFGFLHIIYGSIMWYKYDRK